ncbi:FAS1 domain-containing protein [Amniculicola lignicola CBS 123094]|uniref:FAS1 domain-containing protein n=1 Tax=Amniculicola lignicola CBS 123094 TaxID=1392246 RepID=A0A6A5WKW2_9PLEO|nr:FAS1 domain-containing protein [Amniculicola lignicola CBS 123094]
MLYRPATLLLLSSTLYNGIQAQSLIDAISKNPSLSNFTAFYTANTVFASAFFSNESMYPITFLVPSNTAFATFQNQTGKSLTEIAPVDLLRIVQYHTLVSGLTTENFTSRPEGMTIPTLMIDETYNNRSVGVEMASKFGGPERSSGQVVFVKPATGSSPSKNKFRLKTRQSGSGISGVRSGLGSTVNLTTTNGDEGKWDGGYYHIIDRLLTPPDLCTKTIRGAGLVNLDRALNRSGIWPQLDGSANVTCLGPSNDAFAQAGNPQDALNQTELTKALFFHTLPMVAYSDYLVDGMEIRSVEGAMVRVRVEDEGGERRVWFNNARLVEENVLVHNGLVHVLDAVMLPLDQLNSTTSATPSATPSATSSSATSATTTGSGTPAASSSGAAVANIVHRKGWEVLGALGMVMAVL